mmetsp:Transcript_16601/g.22295  ORF Transcript_16601/g.22295 Transcript_16601/m.22295 type:complete len:103 (+) Transcript_16601:1215-1523(+)
MKVSRDVWEGSLNDQRSHHVMNNCSNLGNNIAPACECATIPRTETISKQSSTILFLVGVAAGDIGHYIKGEMNAVPNAISSRSVQRDEDRFRQFWEIIYLQV